MTNCNKKETCCGCGACVYACPHHAISLVADEEGFLYPVVEVQNCTSCGLCHEICPIGKPGILCEGIPETYAAQSLDDSIRKASSSGGIFTLLAEYVLEQNGVVFGAALNEELVVEHQYTETISELERFRGSKYVQSNTVKAYPQVLQFLMVGRIVLFSGTPCQIAGLKAYLRKEYEQLFCVDVACHGVPSPKIWKAYLSYAQKCSASQVTAAYFRDKTYGWRNFSMKLELENGSVLISRKDQDAYMRAFLADYDLRPSCYNCAFKRNRINSDITLADFWGIESVLPSIDDDQGTSLVLINSQKGAMLIQDISEKIRLVSVDYASAVAHNPAIVRSVYCPEERESYILDSRNTNFARLTNQYFSMKLHWRMIRKLKKILRMFMR